MYGRRSLLSIWTVYDHPSDAPDCFIARRWEVRPGHHEPIRTEDVLRSQTLEPLRRHFREHGLTCLPRQTGDDVNIMESWL